MDTLSSTAEKQLNNLITRRSKQKDPEEESEAWQESVRRFNEKRKQMARLEWHAFHCDQAERHRRTLEELVGYHERQAETANGRIGMNKQEIRKGLESGKLRERGNGWKNVRPRSQMRAIDRGYQGSEKKKRRPAAKYSFFGGKR